MCRRFLHGIVISGDTKTGLDMISLIELIWLRVTSH